VVEVAQIIVHEADEPNLVAHLFDADSLAGEDQAEIDLLAIEADAASSRAMNFRRSSVGLHAFQGILRSPQKTPLCNPCVRYEMSPLSQEGHQLLFCNFRQND